MAEQGLLAQLQAVKNDRTTGQMCAIGKWLKTLDSKERGDYSQIIDSTEYTAAAIGRVLRKNGIRVSDGQVRYHRNRKQMKGCECK